MIEQLFEVPRHDCVENVEEVGSVTILALPEIVGKVPHDLFLLLDKRPKLSDTELIVVRHKDPFNLRNEQQVLLFIEHLLDKVFRNLLVGHQIILT